MPATERHSKTSKTSGNRRSGRRRRSALFGFLLLLSFLLLLLVVAIAAAVNTIRHQAGGQQQHPVILGNQLLLDELEQQQEPPPLCVGNLLNGQAYDGIGDELTNVISRRSLLKSRDDGTICHLIRYTAQPIVTCLDALFHQVTANTSSNPLMMAPDELIFVFMGDSRIRQQFFNFVKMIPNYDWVTVPSPIPPKYHGEIEMTSSLLRLRISFKWQPLVNDKLINTLRQIGETAASDPKKRPQFILLSMAVWHMLREHGADIGLYQSRMTQLGPILASLSDHCGRIIWLRQYTSVDFYGDNGKSNTLVVSDKLRHYNRIAVQGLAINKTDAAADSSNISSSRQRGVYLWDSSDPFADEYVRSCAILKRYEHPSDNAKEYATAYANCNDYVHTGYSALSQATQLLFNDLCNAHLS